MGHSVPLSGACVLLDVLSFVDPTAHSKSQDYSQHLEREKTLSFCIDYVGIDLSNILGESGGPTYFLPSIFML